MEMIKRTDEIRVETEEAVQELITKTKNSAADDAMNLHHIVPHIK